MKTFVFALLLSVCFVAPAYGQAKAHIKGPSEVLPGALLFLSSEEAVGDIKLWMIPDELKAVSATCGHSIFFSIPKPGVYKFGLTVSVKEPHTLDFSFHTVTVKGSTPDPDPTPDPIPIPPSIENLKKINKEAILKLNDPVTTTALFNAILSTIQATPPGTDLSTAKINLVMAIEKTLANRSRELFRTKDWINIWRVPINNEFSKLNIKTTEEYFTIYLELIR